MKPEPSSLLAQLLDLHLARAIKRLKGSDVMTSKFLELAAGIQSDLKNLNDQADELAKRREDLRKRGEAVMTKHREHQDDVAAGLTALERAIADMEGGNNPPREGSGATPAPSFQK